MIDNSYGGSLNVDGSTSATLSGTAEQILKTYTLKGGTLNRNNQRLRIIAWGHSATNSNNKTFKLYFGASSASSGVVTDSNKNWIFEAQVIRNSQTSQSFFSRVTTGSSQLGFNLSPTEDLSGDVIIKVTGTDGTDSAGDITCSGFIIEGFVEP